MNKGKVLVSLFGLLSAATIFVACKRINYKKLPNGNTYYVGRGSAKSSDTNTVKVGKFVSLHYTQIIKRAGKPDTTFADTRATGMPQGVMLDSNLVYPQDIKRDFGFRGIIGGHAGDSIVSIQKIETIVKENPRAEETLGKKGTIENRIFIVKVYNSQDEYTAEIKGIKTKEFDEYVAKNNLAESFKTADSVYVTIKTPGTGAIAKGNFVKVNYTGKTTNGKIFDSNIEDVPGRPKQPAEMPKATLDFTVGAQEMIPGFDAAMKYFSKGAKGTIVLPYYKAYGERGNQGIAPFEALVFDVEVVDVLASKPVEKAMKNMPPPPPPAPNGAGAQHSPNDGHGH